jgi:hypothetical protein
MSGGIPAWAVRGAKVVCVDASNQLPDRTQLQLGVVYTIDAVTTTPFGVFGYRLKETPNNIGGLGVPYGYNSKRFRPVVTRTQEQDIAQFLPLLKPQKAVERA